MILAPAYDQKCPLRPPVDRYYNIETAITLLITKCEHPTFDAGKKALLQCLFLKYIPKSVTC